MPSVVSTQKRFGVFLKIERSEESYSQPQKTPAILSTSAPPLRQQKAVLLNTVKNLKDSSYQLGGQLYALMVGF